MGRHAVLSNGKLFVGLDENGLVHDFYYPYVGEDNLTNARSLQHKIGVWVDNTFSWSDDGSWNVSVDFEAHALVSHVTMTSDSLGVSLVFHDFIDSEYDVLIRRVEVSNRADSAREIRLFMHQVFQISSAGRGDTAMYVPDDHYLLDYKGRCCLLIAGKTSNGADFDQFAVGNYGIEGKSGTFEDALDGELSGNLVEHGGVDSVIRFSQTVGVQDNFKVDYWVVAAKSQTDAQVVHTKLKYQSIDERLEATRKYYSDWLQPALQRTQSLDNSHKTALLKSLLVIKAHCDERGSILASGDSSIFNYGRDYYCYCWPRDASYALWPLIRLGIYEEAWRFFDFARDTMHKDGYMMHKYQPDRSIGSTWHPMVHGRSKELAIQEDETASVVFMMGEYFDATDDKQFINDYYDTFIYPAATFMTGFIDDSTGLPHASYDLWEERFLTSTYTVGTVIAGLQTAVRLAEVVGKANDTAPWVQTVDKLRRNLGVLYHPDGYYRKGYLLQSDGSLAYDDSLDISSLQGVFMFAGLGKQEPTLISTARAVENRLRNTSPIGGVVRYEQDNYFRTKTQYPGNPWIVCTAWLAQYYSSTGNDHLAKELVDWCLARAVPSGILSEQFDPDDGSPVSVTPLVWSHAELINTILDINNL